MQTTLYYREEDQYLLDLVDREAERRRTSRSAVVMAILEQHFARGKKLGEILVGMGVVSPQNVRAALADQQSGKNARPIGEILVARKWAAPEEIRRALLVQERTRGG